MRAIKAHQPSVFGVVEQCFTSVLSAVACVRLQPAACALFLYIFPILERAASRTSIAFSPFIHHLRASSPAAVA